MCEPSESEMPMTATVAYLVCFDGMAEPPVALRVQIVCPYDDSLLPRGHRKRPDARHDITHDLARLEEVDETFMLVLQLAVPVNLGVVEAKLAAVLEYLDFHLVGSLEELVLEGAELGSLADIVDFVDDCPHRRILVDDGFCDDMLIWEVALPEIEMC